MPKKIRFAVLVIVFGVGAAALGFATHYWLRTSSVTTPSTATDFALRDLAGKTHSLADYRGKLVLLNFWATWCPPCRKEIPLFIELQRRYQNQGLQIVGISIDNPEAVARYWQEMRINYPLLLADETTFELMAAYGNRTGGLPYSVLIDANGKVRGVKIGAYHEQELVMAIQAALSPSQPVSP